jgi:hypothetical protein
LAKVLFIGVSNKETSRWDEAKDWEGVCIPSPIRARQSNFASLVVGRSFRPKGRGFKPARKIDKLKTLLRKV